MIVTTVLGVVLLSLPIRHPWDYVNKLGFHRGAAIAISLQIQFWLCPRSRWGSLELSRLRSWWEGAMSK